MTNLMTHVSIAVHRENLEALAARERRWYRVPGRARIGLRRRQPIGRRPNLVPCCV